VLHAFCVFLRCGKIGALEQARPYSIMGFWGTNFRGLSPGRIAAEVADSSGVRAILKHLNA